MPKQFWVIGAEYSDMQFMRPVGGSTRLFGPYESYHDAREQWRARVMMSRHEATTRYTIVSNGGGTADAAAQA